MTSAYIYRGWRIESTEGTEIGYSVPSGRRPPGTVSRPGGRSSLPSHHRKFKGWEIQYPDGGNPKFVKTLVAVKKYIDEYLGTPSDEKPRPAQY